MASISSLLNTNNAASPVAQLTPIAPPNSTGGSGLSFGDVLDAVNPLQHIPVVSSLYRAVSGHQISAASQIAGDTLYGAAMGGASAIIGFAASAADVAVKQITGENISQHVVSAVSSIGNAVAGNSSTNTANTVTPLLPSPNAIASAAPPIGGGTSFAAQLTNATNAINRSGTYYQSTNAHYQRVQAFDAINKSLLKMTA